MTTYKVMPVNKLPWDGSDIVMDVREANTLTTETFGNRVIRLRRGLNVNVVFACYGPAENHDAFSLF